MLQKKIEEENTEKESVGLMVRRRAPWIIAGLLGGLLITLVVAKYRAILSADVRLAFFMPIIVYLSDAVGGQTEAIHIRSLSKRKEHFSRYIFKESMVGLILGIISGLASGFFTALWLDSLAIGLVVGLTMFVNITIAPSLAVLISGTLYKRGKDPALGGGPIGTIIQDLVSLLVYFAIASMIIL